MGSVKVTSFLQPRTATAAAQMAMDRSGVMSVLTRRKLLVTGIPPTGNEGDVEFAESKDVEIDHGRQQRERPADDEQHRAAARRPALVREGHVIASHRDRL